MLAKMGFGRKAERTRRVSSTLSAQFAICSKGARSVEPEAAYNASQRYSAKAAKPWPPQVSLYGFDAANSTRLRYPSAAGFAHAMGRRGVVRSGHFGGI